MDTSETYIKMCQKAEEIQANGTIDSSQECVCRQGEHRILVWLPTQSDLQEMVEGDTAYKLGSFFRQLLLGLSHGLGSMEQLWLAFVMKEKYNKTWNGEEWE